MENIPIGVYIFMLISLVVLGIISLTPQSMTSSLFLINQMFQNSCLITILCFFAAIFQDKNTFFQKYMHILLPCILIVIVWLKSLVIYANELLVQCTDSSIYTSRASYPFRFDLLLWNTSKIAIAIFITYLIVNFFPFFQTPFYELFDTSHPIISYLALGIWLGCATWPAETSCYFNLSTSGCLPATRIVFKDVATTVPENPSSSSPPPVDVPLP